MTEQRPDSRAGLVCLVTGATVATVGQLWFYYGDIPDWSARAIYLIYSTLAVGIFAGGAVKENSRASGRLSLIGILNCIGFALALILFLTWPGVAGEPSSLQGLHRIATFQW